MKVNELIEKLSLEVLSEGETDREITGCYSGDLLSWVMSKAKDGDVWLTVMGNINAIAVAVLCDCACIVLTDKAALDDDARLKAESMSIPVLQSEKSTFDLAVEISKLL